MIRRENEFLDEEVKQLVDVQQRHKQQHKTQQRCLTHARTHACTHTHVHARIHIHTHTDRHHCLPLVYRITFKLVTVTYCTLSIQQSTYLPIVNLLHFCGNSRTIRSSVSKLVFVPKTKLDIGKRAFSVAASTIWNQLPIAIKSSETVVIFHKKLQTFV